MRVTITIPDDVLARIDQAAAAQERSRAGLIRRVLTTQYPPTVNLKDIVDLGAATPHGFTPSEGNSLRCKACGRKRGEH